NQQRDNKAQCVFNNHDSGKGERGSVQEKFGVRQVNSLFLNCKIGNSPVCPRISRYVDDSVPSGTSGSWSSSGLSSEASFSLAGFLPDDLVLSYDGDSAVR